MVEMQLVLDQESGNRGDEMIESFDDQVSAPKGIATNLVRNRP